MMKKVTILALNDAAATTITGPMDVFNLTGVLWNQVCGKEISPKFKVEIVTPTGKPVQCLNNISITPHCCINDVKKTDLILVSAILDIDKTLQEQGEIIDWLRYHHAQGAWLGSVCTGSFVLAETGLLDGKVATTHWGLADLFRDRYPAVNLKPKRLLTDAGSLYTSGAFNSCIDLSIYLVEKIYGHEIAAECAKSLVYDIGRFSQTPYTPFNFQRNHNDEDILLSQRDLERNFSKIIDVEQMANHRGMARRTFERRFKNATGDTPLVYLQRVRVEKAKKMLETGESTFDEISYEVGYEDTSFFRKIFVKHTDLRPKEYRNRFHRFVDCNM